MATKLILVKHPNMLVAVDRMVQEAMQAIPNGAMVNATVTVPRNLQQHKLLFALLNLVWKNQPEPQMFPTVESLLDTLKMATGHMHEVRTVSHDGRGGWTWTTIMVPSSISFANMDNTSFKEWFDSAIRVILERVLPNCQQGDLEQQVYDMLREPGPDSLER